jgi:hypothetical protein
MAITDDCKTIPTFENDFIGSNCFDKFFMRWANRIIDYINKYKSLDDADQCVKMYDYLSSDKIARKLESTIEYMQSKNKDFNYKDQMLMVVLRTFKWEISVVIFWGLLAEIFAITNLFYSSFFIRWLEEDGAKWEGYLYAFGFIAFVYIAQLFRVNYFFNGN